MEPFATPEIYASGLGAVHIIGGGACALVWYRNAGLVECASPMCRRVTGTTIIPAASIAEAVQLLRSAIEPSDAGAPNVLRLR